MNGEIEEGAETPLAIPIGPMSALEDLVRRVEDALRSAKRMPLSKSVLVDRAEMLEVLEAIKRSIPEEIASARAVLRDRDAMLERAERDAERIAERARREREKLLDKAEIVQAAGREADRLAAEAESASRRIRQQADEYVEAKLANFEVVLQKTLAAVERGRQRLAGRIEAEQLGGPEAMDDVEP